MLTNSSNESDNKTEKSRRDNTRLLIRIAIGVYLLWLTYKLLRGYFSGADTGMSPALLFGVCAAFVIVVVVIAVVTIRELIRLTPRSAIEKHSEDESDE